MTVPRFLAVAYRRAALLPAWVRRMDRRAGRHINSHRAPRGADRVNRQLSRIADRSVLWFAIGGVLVIFGQHRAAVRGLTSLTVASALANLVGKRIFGGNRPLTKDIPIGRRLKRSPSSPSFPSGHSASATAFTAGIALERPGIGLAVAPLAGSVAYSRIHTGAHWLSDVLGGITIGVVVATVGRLIVPVTQKRPVRHGGTEIVLPAVSDGDGVLFVANPSSGADVMGRTDPLTRIRKRMPLAIVHTLTGDETPEDVVVAALASPRPPLALGVCGGDGTVTAMAGCARRAALPLAVVPGGTFNHFARALGIESADDALDAIVAGTGVRVDVAELELDGTSRITVLNAASIGLYPAFVAERERLQRGLNKWIAGVVAAIRVLRRSDPVEIEIDGARRSVWSVFAGVDRNAPGVPAPLQRQRLDGGVLDVRILTARSRVHAVAALSFGRKTSAVLRAVGLIPKGDAVESFETESLTVTVRRKDGQTAAFAYDGEVAEVDAGPSSASVTLIAGGLDVYGPASPRTVSPVKGS
jgi:diacylglycerol kinase family enzyme/membrane-associated phospholipid phosphatase